MAVHVIIETFERQPIFSDPRRARAVQALVAAHRQTLSAMLMPDHLHWIVLPGSEIDDTVGRFKSRSTHQVWKWGENGRVWQRSYFATPLRSAAILKWTVSYIQANPVRAGLVSRASAYRWRVERGPARG